MEDGGKGGGRAGGTIGQGRARRFALGAWRLRDSQLWGLQLRYFEVAYSKYTPRIPECSASSYTTSARSRLVVSPSPFIDRNRPDKSSGVVLAGLCMSLVSNLCPSPDGGTAAFVGLGCEAHAVLIKMKGRVAKGRVAKGQGQGLQRRKSKSKRPNCCCCEAAVSSQLINTINQSERKGSLTFVLGA